MMRENLRTAIAKMRMNEGASQEAVHRAEQQLNFRLPAAFKEFLQVSNGASGDLGSNYIEIWSTDQLVELNVALEMDVYAPGLIAFGTDGGNELYAFDVRDVENPVVQVPMIGMNLKDVWNCAPDFTQFMVQKSNE